MVGPYRLLGRLGAGGMGQVYLARSPGGRAVAVKVIRPELTEDRGFRDRFAHEVAAAREVSGIFTAPVIDADPAAQVPWMATAYVPGPSLAAAVKRQGPLPAHSVLVLGAGLAEGLQAIHAAGLVHRDLKPSNVLLAADGPRVIDFGISRAIGRPVLTTAGVVMGSPGYMSPEQALGREIGRPTDVFSLGAVLAFAASGHNPFGGGPAPTLMYRVVHEAPDLSRTPSGLWALLDACLAKDPAARPTTNDLLRHLSRSVDLLTPGWLPPSVAAELIRYRPAAAVRAAAPVAREAGRTASDPAASPVPVWRPAPPAGSGPLSVGSAAGPASATGSQAGPAGSQAGPGAYDPVTRRAGDRAGESAPVRSRRPGRLWLAAAGVGTTAMAVVAALILSSPGQAKPRTGLSPTPASSHTTAAFTSKSSTSQSAPQTGAVRAPQAHRSSHAATHPTSTPKDPGNGGGSNPLPVPTTTPSCASGQAGGQDPCGSDEPTPAPTCAYDAQDGQDDLCGSGAPTPTSSPSLSPTPTPTPTPTPS
jgi:hypothetical protein